MTRLRVCLHIISKVVIFPEVRFVLFVGVLKGGAEAPQCLVGYCYCCVDSTYRNQILAPFHSEEGQPEKLGAVQGAPETKQVCL